MDPRTRYTKHIIAETFIDLLKDKPLNQITVTDICKNAQINRGSFYKYYKNVYDLMEQLQNEGIDELQKMLEKTDTSSGSAVRDILFQVLAVIKSRKSLIESMNVNICIADDDFIKRMMNFITDYMRNTVSIDTDQEADQTIMERRFMVNQYILGGCSNLIMNWINTGMTMEEETLVDYILEFTNKSQQDYYIS